MGSVKRDIHKNSRNFNQKYDEKTIQGVTHLLEDIHKLFAKRRFGDIDAAIILMSLKDAIKQAELTDRQKEVLHLRYEKQYTQSETAEELKISQQRVQVIEREAIEKISVHARSIWEDDEE